MFDHDGHKRRLEDPAQWRLEWIRFAGHPWDIHEAILLAEVRRTNAARELYLSAHPGATTSTDAEYARIARPAVAAWTRYWDEHNAEIDRRLDSNARYRALHPRGRLERTDDPYAAERVSTGSATPHRPDLDGSGRESRSRAACQE
jgi:hypothetical protein